MVRLLWIPLFLVPLVAGTRTQGGEADPHLDEWKKLKELEALLAEGEKGSEVDLDRIDDLVRQTRRRWRGNGPADGAIYWNELTRQLAGEYPRTVQRLILKGIDDADSFIFGLGDVGGDENVDFLIQYLGDRLGHLATLEESGEKEDPHWRFHRAAVLALGRCKSEKAWPVLHRALRCEFSHVSCNAIVVLAAAGDESIIPVIREWLVSKDDGRRATALRAVVSLSTDGVKPKLFENLREPLMVVLSDLERRRDEVMKALVSIGDETALPRVHEMAMDESEYLRELEEVKSFRHPWGRNHPLNYRQRQALDATAKLASPKSLAVLDGLALHAEDEHVRSRAKEIAEDIRKRHGLGR